MYDSECEGFLLYTESGTLAEDDIKLVDRGYYKEVPISVLTSYKNENRYVTLAFTANGKVKYTVPCYNKCIIDEDKTEMVRTRYSTNCLIQHVRKYLQANY